MERNIFFVDQHKTNFISSIVDPFAKKKKKKKKKKLPPATPSFSVSFRCQDVFRYTHTLYKMKIIPTWPRASLPRFYRMTLQDCSGSSSTCVFLSFHFLWIFSLDINLYNLQIVQSWFFFHTNKIINMSLSTQRNCIPSYIHAFSKTHIPYSSEGKR